MGGEHTTQRFTTYHSLRANADIDPLTNTPALMVPGHSIGGSPAASSASERPAALRLCGFYPTRPMLSPRADKIK